MAQELHFKEPKFTLAKFGKQMLLSQDLKNNPQVLCMLLMIFGID
jgi:hypothetical protein